MILFKFVGKQDYQSILFVCMVDWLTDLLTGFLIALIKKRNKLKLL